MTDKKGKTFSDDKKGKPTIDNDQLGENAGTGRTTTTKGNTKPGKCP
jgi:hypothetical protein